MDQKTKQLVDDAEARAAKATPGPWIINSKQEFTGCDIRGSIQSATREVLLRSPGSSDADFVFAAHARTDVPVLCLAVKEQDKRARHAEEERDLFSKRIDELEKQLASKPIPTRKDVALAILRGIGPNPAEFMAAGKDAFLGLADRIIQMFSDPPSPKQTPAKQ